MRRNFLLPLITQSLLACLLTPLYAQPPGGGGEYLFPVTQCISPEQGEEIKANLRSSIIRLEKEGRLPPLGPTAQGTLIWPVRQSAFSNDPGFYGISNYVDHDLTFPSKLKDYNCGSRTYDLSSGYNHKGVDIFIYPFPQAKQQQSLVEIIAAAAGTIIGKNDGNPDNSCSFCSNCYWNAVYVRHADGSVAWYGHMKNGSLTTKPVGAEVAQGEYLGVVGSSGNSTGPHLHFELYANASQTQLIDPFGGPCNSLNGQTSWWASQKPYRESTINRIQTNWPRVSFGSCPQVENSNICDIFAFSDTVFLTSFYHDQQSGAISRHEIFNPTGLRHTTWDHNANTTYNASWWWWYFTTLPAIEGYWTYRVTYLATGQAVSHTFYRGTNPPVTTLKHGQWNDAGVWSNGQVPGPGSRVFVRHRLVITEDIGYADMVVQEKGQLIVAPGVQIQFTN